MKSDEALAAIQTAVGDLCTAFNAGLFTPLLEADFTAYVYHRLLSNGVPADMVYLTARVCGDAERSLKPDLVIGECNLARACTRPALICETKVFQRWGHNPQQMNRRFHSLLDDDIRSLEEFRSVPDCLRVEIVGDFYVSPQLRGFTAGICEGQSRLGAIENACRRVGAGLILVHPQSGTSVGWRMPVAPIPA